VARIDQLLTVARKQRGYSADKARVEILTHALNLAAIVGGEFANSTLQQVPAAYDEFAVQLRDLPKVDEGVFLLQAAVNATRYFPHDETVLFASNRLLRLLEAQNLAAADVLLAEPCLRALRQHHRHTELEHLCQQLAECVPQDNLAVWVPVAASWVYLGRNERVEEVLESARALLFGPRPKMQGDPRLHVGPLYVEAVALQSAETARRRLEEVFTRMHDIRDCYTTAGFYALANLRMTEAVILAVLERKEPSPLRVGG
jgi:hypothetical protein